MAEIGYCTGADCLPAFRMLDSSRAVKNSSMGVRMTFRRVGGLAAVAVAILLWLACGQVYRPVVIPCVGQVPGCPVETPPTPSNFHAVFALGNNAPNYPGGAMQI